MNPNEINRVIEALQQLKAEITELKQQKMLSTPVTESKSATLKELFTALAKAQAEIRAAGLTSENPYFKSNYADLAEVIRVSRPALSKFGLSVIQQILCNEHGQNMLHTVLAHTSGEWIESRMRILPTKNDIQSMGSYITYLKRYCYAALVGVVATNEDDDGERAVYDQREVVAKGVALNTKYNPKEASHETITVEQLEELNYELQEYPDLAEQVLDGFKILSLSDMPKSKFLPAINKIRQIKQLRNGK